MVSVLEAMDLGLEELAQVVLDQVVLVQVVKAQAWTEHLIFFSHHQRIATLKILNNLWL